MGSEQSTPAPAGGTAASTSRVRSGSGARLQRGSTVPPPQRTGSQHQDDPTTFGNESRPASPPMSICSDSDLPPYISYTDRPIGDSPKLRNKGHSAAAAKSARPSSVIIGGSSGSSSKSSGGGSGVRGKIRPPPTHNIVVVKAAAAKDVGVERDPDIVKLQSIPQFLPVMRGTLSLPANRDPEVLERLQPAHMSAMCSRLQQHFNACATKVASDQQEIVSKIREIDQTVSAQHVQLVERQRQYAGYAEAFTQVRKIQQMLARCNSLLNDNIESLETLNNLLPVDSRLEPFVWTTEHIETPPLTR